MSEPTCRWVSSTQPRVVPNRHGYGCNDESCRGCLACPESHCRVCGKEHAPGACPGCLAAMRGDIDDILAKCRALPDEVEHRGVDGEAFVLLGPVADPEARGHREASAAVGRAWVDEAGHVRHPLTVLGTWAMVVEDARGATETGRVGVESAAAYIHRHLTWVGASEWLPVDDLARELRQCRAHMERVLHDQSEGDRANIGCFDCGGDLERRLTDAGFEDHWTCRKCRRRYTSAEYNFALRAAIEAESA